MINPFIPGKTMNAGGFSRKVSWVSVPEFSGKHPAIQLHMNNPNARKDHLTLIIIRTALDCFDCMPFDQIFFKDFSSLTYTSLLVLYRLLLRSPMDRIRLKISFIDISFGFPVFIRVKGIAALKKQISDKIKYHNVVCQLWRKKLFIAMRGQG